MTERGEPRPAVVLATFAGVCALADVSPLAKLCPPSVVLGALSGEADGGRAWSLYALLVAAALAAPVVALGLVISSARAHPRGGGRGAALANGSIVVVMYAVARFFEPRAAALRALGRGSDQSDCIVMPARALAAGHWPYDRALIWSGNACSPGMGWILLATPFVLLAGYASFLVAGGAALVLVPERALGARTRTAAPSSSSRASPPGRGWRRGRTTSRSGSRSPS